MVQTAGVGPRSDGAGPGPLFRSLTSGLKRRDSTGISTAAEFAVRMLLARYVAASPPEVHRSHSPTPFDEKGYPIIHAFPPPPVHHPPTERKSLALKGGVSLKDARDSEQPFDLAAGVDVYRVGCRLTREAWHGEDVAGYRDQEPGAGRDPDLADGDGESLGAA